MDFGMLCRVWDMASRAYASGNANRKTAKCSEDCDVRDSEVFRGL